MQLRYLEAWEQRQIPFTWKMMAGKEKRILLSKKKCGVTNPAKHFSNLKRLNPWIGASELYEFSQLTDFVALKLLNV